jgi:hypothetical protein
VATNRIITKQFCLLFGVSLAVASLLLTHWDGPAPDPEGPGVIFVYFPSLCAQAGDPSDCHEIIGSARPSFESMAACSAYADGELRRESNPKLMASCMKQREG